MIPINVGLYCVPHASQGHGENSNPSSFSRPSLNTSRVRQPPRPYAAKCIIDKDILLLYEARQYSIV